VGMKYLACTVRQANPVFADQILELWSEHEEGASLAARLVRQLDKLECLDQAVIYEERSGVNLEEFMGLEEQVTLPELRDLVDMRLQDYERLRSRARTHIVIIFVSGGPGVGKGTQCARAAKEFDLCHISVGDLLRAEAECPTSPYGDFISESIEKSVLIPPQLTTHLLHEQMEKAQATGQRKFVLDGFPRNLPQITDFEAKIASQYCTISLNCSDLEMKRRLQNRAGSSKRVDDNPESVLRRLHTFNQNNAPVLDHLQSRGKVYHVDSDGSVDQVYEVFRSTIVEILNTSDA